MKFSKLSILLPAFIFCQSCLLFGSEEEISHQDAEQEGTVHWTKEKSEYANIQLQVASAGFIQNLVQVSGKIIIHPDHVAYVIPKVNGAASDIRKNLGDSVEKDEVLALIESKEISDAKAHYLNALQKFNMQKKLLEKEEFLKGISPEQDYLKATFAKEEAAIEYESAVQNLYAFGFSSEEIGRISSEEGAHRRFYEIKAPLRGKILQRNLTLGEQVNTTTRAFVIGNFDKIWIEMNVSQSDAQYLKEGLPVEIVASDGKKASVTICQFNPTISDETRTATAIAVMENGSEKWTPGEYVSVYIQTSLSEVPLVVSKEAIQNIKDENYVFVEEGGNFTPYAVKLGKMDDKNVEIISGLKVGAAYACSNTFCLKSEYEKEE